MMGKLFKYLNEENISKEDVFKLAQSVKGADLNDEQNIRNLIRTVSQIANKEVSEELENKLVETIKKEGIPADFTSLF